ncbi:hypothetical protein Tco_0331977 [Tanacetum coccineum]
MKARFLETFSTTIHYDSHWIYIQKFWHSLKLDDSKDKFKFFLDFNDVQFSVDDLRRIFQLPQATECNNVGFVAALCFSQMLPFFQNDLGFSLLMRLPSHFVIPYASRTPNPDTTEGESSAPCKPTVIRFRVRRQKDPETRIPVTTEIEIDSLDEAKQLSIATQRSLEDLEA